MVNAKAQDSLERIFSTIAKRVSPTLEEAKSEKAFAEGVKSRLQKAFGKKATLFFVGSTARDTGIRGDRDIDIFVAFPKEKKKDAIVKETISTVKRVLPTDWEMHYAEHPYLQGHLGGYKLEIVPCFKIEVNEGIISAVDRTPLHAQYLQKHLTQKQKRDVRVLKALLKAHDIYGAELEVGGFSGLVCEYLVLNYRSLSNLLAAASIWKPQVVLDIEDYYDEEYDQLKKRFASPLIIVDFIDKNRNAAAAITANSFAKFIALSRAMARSPTDKLFARADVKYSERDLAIQVKARNLQLLKFARPKGLVSDIMIPQLRRSEASIAKQLSLNDFKIFNSASFYDEKNCFIMLECEQLECYPLRKIFGPPVHFAKDVPNFLLAHKDAIRGPFIENGKVVVEVQRKIISAQDVIPRIKKSPAKYGIASHFLAPIKIASILEKDSLLYELKRNNSLRESVAKFLFSKDVVG
ncbi:MAG: CCA tRNA nucleotidyltransferase [Candidatus Micrarchaeota archaeon]